MTQSPNTMKAVTLLSDVISAQNLPLPLSPPKPVKSPTSALGFLLEIIGEMEAVTCHSNTSMVSLGRHHIQEEKVEAKPARLRREASREISSTVTGELPGRRPRGSNLRREASSDLSATITGPLQRPAEVETDASDDNYFNSPLSSPTGMDKNIFISRSESISERYEHSFDNDTVVVPRKQYSADAITVNWLDLRVGKILTVSKHESAEKLYCETIDVGESEPRSIASGLVPYYSLEEMKDRMVVVVCNLKSRNLVGFPSNGMVLCATAEGENRLVELLTPPSGAQPGDRVFAPGVPGEVVTPQKCDKKKIFPKVAAGLRVDEMGRFCWEGTVLRVGELDEAEVCTSPVIRDGEVG